MATLSSTDNRYFIVVNIQTYPKINKYQSSQSKEALRSKGLLINIVLLQGCHYLAIWIHASNYLNGSNCSVNILENLMTDNQSIVTGCLIKLFFFTNIINSYLLTHKWITSCNIILRNNNLLFTVYISSRYCFTVNLLDVYHVQ